MPQKPIKREYSAGGAVYRKKGKKTFWLVIQPEGGGHWSKGRWQFPKGWIEKGEKSAETAKREVEEETGIKAKAIAKIDDLKVFFYDEEKNKVFKTITLFLMKYQREGERKEDAEKIAAAEWLPYKEAYKRLTFKSEKEILAKAKKILKGGKKQPGLF